MKTAKELHEITYEIAKRTKVAILNSLSQQIVGQIERASNNGEFKTSFEVNASWLYKDFEPLCNKLRKLGYNHSWVSFNPMNSQFCNLIQISWEEPRDAIE